MASVVKANGSKVYGDDAFSRKDYESAAIFYSTALSQDNVAEHTEILRGRYQCYFQMGLFCRAFDDMMEILKRLPAWVAGYLQAGVCLTKMEYYTEAVNMFIGGLKLDPGNDEIKTRLAEARQNCNEVNNKSNTISHQSFAADADAADSELIAQERKLISSYGRIDIGKPTDSQNASFLKSYINEASLHRVNGDLVQAATSLKSVLKISPHDWSIWHILASILYEQKQLKEALQCCDVIPEPARNYDTWLLGGKIREDLGLPVSAELWYRKAVQYGGKRANEASQLFQQVRVSRLDDELALGKQIRVRFGVNGREMYAVNSIAKGTIVFREKPIVLAQTVDSGHINACSSCGKNLMTADDFLKTFSQKDKQHLIKIVQKYWPKVEVICCDKCQLEMYCSERCKHDGWTRHHQILCAAVNSPVKRLYDVCTEFSTLLKKGVRVLDETWSAMFSPMFLARIWASIVSDVQRFAEARGEQPNSHDWANAKAVYRRFIAAREGSYARAVPKMVRIMKDIFENEKNAIKLDITEMEFDQRYYQVACNVQAFVDPVPPFQTFKDALKQTKLWKEVSKLLPKNEELEAMFAGLFPLQTSMNHACNNNIVVRDDLIGGIPGVAVYATRDISLDEEITTTYIDTKMVRRERRERLYRAYNFWCQCQRCQFEGDDSGTCTGCGKRACKDKSFMGCSRCHRAWYCSTKCQKCAWKAGHKKICKQY